MSVLSEVEIARLWTAYGELEAEATGIEATWWGLARTITIVALGTAMRSGELLGLRLSDVHLLDSRVVAREALVNGRGPPRPRAGHPGGQSNSGRGRSGCSHDMHPGRATSSRASRSDRISPGQIFTNLTLDRGPLGLKCAERLLVSVLVSGVDVELCPNLAGRTIAFPAEGGVVLGACPASTNGHPVGFGGTFED
jgi:hypothetical protein